MPETGESIFTTPTSLAKLAAIWKTPTTFALDPEINSLLNQNALSFEGSTASLE